MEHPALVCRRKRSEPHARLVSFPHAGGSEHDYAGWDESLPRWLEVHSIAYPGRGSRPGEPFYESMEAAAVECHAAIRTIADRPLFLVGHSFGALMAVEVAMRLTTDGMSPLRLFVSSMPPPHLVTAWKVSLTAMPDAQLLTALARRGWLSAATAENGGTALVGYALPSLRADLRLLEMYERHSATVLVPITAIAGELDASVSLAELKEWAQWSAGEFEVETVHGGGHFFIETHDGLLCAIIALSVERSLASLQRSVLTSADGDVSCSEGTSKSGTVTERLAVLALRPSPQRDAAAIISPGSGGATTSFWYLNQLARVLATALIRPPFNVVPDSVCAVYLPASAEYIIANVAIFTARGAMVYFEVNYTRKLIADLIKASGTRCVLTVARLSATLPDDMAHLLLDEGWDTRLWALIARATLQEQAVARLFDSYVDPQSLAYCSMSSGTTGAPKAILVEHHSCMHNILARESVCPYDVDLTADIEACNVFFVWEALRAPVHGRSTLVVPNEIVVDGRRLTSFLLEHKATRFMVTPSLLRNLLDQPGLNFARFVGTQLRHVLLEGEVVPTALVNDFATAFDHFRTTLVNYYSTWESLDVACTTLFDPSRRDETKTWLRTLPPGGNLAPVGMPLPGVCLLIRDEISGRTTPRGVPGAVYIIAKSIARGYLGDLGKTKSRFSANPTPILASADAGITAMVVIPSWALDASVRCYDTGDRGVVLENNSLLLLGRADATVKIRGFKVALKYVEQSVAGAPAIQSCIVRPVIDELSQQPEGIVAYITAASIFNMTHVTQYLREVLPEYAIPSHVVLLDVFPTKPGSGKLDFSRLPVPTDADLIAGGLDYQTHGTAVARALEPAVDDDAERSLRDGWGRIAADSISAAFRGVLGRPVPNDSNLFEVGGHSLHAAKIIGAINTALGVDLAVVDLFDRPSVRELAMLLLQRRRDVSSLGGQSHGGRRPGDHLDDLIKEVATVESGELRPQSLAVVGAAAFLPGADEVADFWHHAVSGHDSLTILALGELRSRGVSPELLADAHFVPAAQMIRGAVVVAFDAFFWGISTREARIIDPQHRKLLETAWHACERAGRGTRVRPTDTNAGRPIDVGVFASTGIDGYLIHHLGGRPLLDTSNPGAIWLGETGSEKDYAPTRISYQLGLTGPSVSVGSACSSSLVSCAMAATAAAAGDCRAALVGGASLTFPNLGYKFVDGLVYSADGHVRPLDAAASGTLFGDGIGVLCLELDDDSLVRRPILCAIAATAVTNDGRAKAGYTAPSAAAQARAIARSTRRAGLASSAVDVIELHATATKLGDAIEVSGIARALGPRDAVASPPLRLTSVKGNIGHANCAAGFTGLLKACLMLGHDAVAPIAHFRMLSPKIRLPAGADVVASANDVDRGIAYLGVSSFGVGGTNAHVTLQADPRSAVRTSGAYGSRHSHHAKTDRLRDPLRLSCAAPTSSIDNEDGLLAAVAYVAMRDAAAEAAASAALAVGRPLTASAKVATAVLASSLEKPPLLAPTARLSRGLVASAPSACDGSGYSKSEPRAIRQVAPAILESMPMRRIESLDALPQHADDVPDYPRRPEVLVMSARTKASLQQQVARLRKFLSARPPRSDLSDISFTLQEGRNHWSEWRVAVVARTAAEAAQALDSAELVARSSNASSVGEVCVAINGCGHGANLPIRIPFGAGLELYETHAAFRSRMRACAAILDGPLRNLPPHDTARGRALAPDSLLDALGYTESARLRSTLATHGKSSILAADLTLSRPAVAEPALFSILYALGACLAFGSADTPTFSQSPYFAAAAGRGIGQLVALALDGAIALDDACLLALERGLHLGEYEFFETSIAVRFQDRPGLIRAPQRAPIVDGLRGNGWLGWLDARDPAYWRRHAEQDHSGCLGTTWTKSLELLLGWRPAIVIAIDCVRHEDAHAASSVLVSRDGRVSAPVSACTLNGTRGAYAIVNCLARAWVRGVRIHWSNVRTATRGVDSALLPPQIVSDVPAYAFAAVPHWINPAASCYAPVNSLEGQNMEFSITPQTAQHQLNHASLVRKGSNLGPWTARVICAPFAGGSGASFNAWRTSAPGWLDIIAIELAGRGARADEAVPHNDLADVTDLSSLRVAIDLLVSDGLPWALVGLSAGALMCLEIAKPMSWPHLARVVIAGRAPPHAFPLVPSEDEIRRLYALAPPDVVASDSFSHFVLPRLQADLARDIRAERRLMECLCAGESLSDRPILMLCGADDMSFQSNMVATWCGSTSSPDSTCTVVPGGHEFILHSVRAVLEEVVMLLEHTRPTTSSSMIPAPASLPNPAYLVCWDQFDCLNYRAQTPAAHIVSVFDFSGKTSDVIAAATSHAGSLVVDCLGCWSVDSDVDWLRREEDAAFNFLGVLKILARTGTPCDIITICRASMRGALFAGTSKCVGFEVPELRCRRVYLRARSTAVSALSAKARTRLLSFLAGASPRGEVDILVTPDDGTLTSETWTRTAPRVRACAAPQRSDHNSLQARAISALGISGNILITGASGGLGIALVDWLIETAKISASRLVLLSRSECMRARFDGYSTRPRICVAKRIEHLPDLEAADLPPCSTVFHLAGTLNDATFLTMTREVFTKPVAPKAGGLVSLRRLSSNSNWPVRSVVAYSSTTSLYGYGGQTNYAAANAFLDAAADFGDDDNDDNRECLPSVTAIHWGPWGGAGMAQPGTKAWDVAIKSGDQPLPTELALSALGATLASHSRGSARLAIFLVKDWSRSPWNDLAATTHLILPSARGDSNTRRLKRNSDDPVESFLQSRVSEWQPSQSLSALGLDSLDLAQIRNDATQLGDSPPLAYFTDPDRTLGELAGLLRGHFGLG